MINCINTSPEVFKGAFRDCKRSSKLRIRHPDFCLSPLQKEPVSKRNRAEHSSLLIVSAGFLLLCTCEVFGIITGKLWIGQREIVFGGTLFFIMFLSQFALNLKYYLIDKKKWRIAEGILLIFCIGLTIFRILNPGHYLMEFL